jgi:mevalonate kinase
MLLAKNESPVFYSKLLLFGEYSIILHSMGLAVPYPLFEGRLLIKHITDASRRIDNSNRELKAFCDYLKLKIQQGALSTDFDIMSFEFDVAQGLYFQSNIPQGFGVGSSGALTASLYDRYVYQKVVHNGKPTNEEILQLKKIFSEMESHFHGSSSGMDPLICYLNLPLLIRSKTLIETPVIPDFVGNKGAVFLLNTGRPRKTEPLVNLFLEKCRNPAFKVLCQNELMVHNDNCINHFLAGETDALFEDLKLLSAFQYVHFEQMIPTLYRDLWRRGLETADWHLKLCGAGGGGFILGFTRDFRAVRKAFEGYQLRIAYQL